MKKLYLIISGLVLVAGSAMAQQVAAPALTKSKENLMKSVRTARPAATAETRTTVWSSSFSDASQWVAGTDPLASADVVWQIGNVTPAGQYQIAMINSTTQADGIGLIDSDNFGAAGTVENTWITSAQAIDCSALAHVSVRLETFYRKWTGEGAIDAEHCLLEVSNDGTTWPDTDVSSGALAAASAGQWDLFSAMAVQATMDNPTTLMVDISSVAANSPTVYVRLRWVGSWGYNWMVDDLAVQETPAHDLAVTKAYNADLSVDFDYTSIPNSQVTDFIFSSKVTNNGYNDENVDVTFDVAGPTPANIPVASSIVASTIDNIILTPATTLSNTVGDYTLTVTTPADDFSATDTARVNFRVDENYYCHFDGNADLFARGFTDALSDGTPIEECAIGAMFTVNADDLVTAAEFAFVPNSATTTWNTVGQVVQIKLYQNTANGWVEVGTTGDITLDDAQYTGNWVHFPFPSPVAVTAGTIYMAEIRRYAQGDMYLMSNVGNEDASTLSYGPFGADPTAPDFFVGWNWTPAIRVAFDPAGVDAITNTVGPKASTLGQNFPNPASELTTVSYNLETPAAVSFIVRDITGRVVAQQNEGVRVGQNTTTINVANLSSGVYTYTMRAGNVVETKEMIVK